MSKKRERILTAALREIANPVQAMQDRLKPDETLNGEYAVLLARDPAYLQGLARAALREAEVMS